MNEAIIIILCILGFGFFIKRGYIINYMREYKKEMKKAWNGEKQSSHLETIQFDKNAFKKTSFAFFCIIVAVLGWFYIAWLGILLALIVYFGMGIILFWIGWFE